MYGVFKIDITFPFSTYGILVEIHIDRPGAPLYDHGGHIMSALGRVHSLYDHHGLIMGALVMKIKNVFTTAGD